jgi:hypothetical protein
LRLTGTLKRYQRAEPARYVGIHCVAPQVRRSVFIDPARLIGVVLCCAGTSANRLLRLLPSRFPVEIENNRLRRAVSDLTLDKLILSEAAKGNFSLFGAHDASSFFWNILGARDHPARLLLLSEVNVLLPHDGIRRIGRSHLSPSRRRACVDHVTTELGISERRACRALGQHRSTQRKTPRHLMTRPR